jgi:chaperone required for assembly of F1-ATPase
MSVWAARRFWTAANVVPEADGFAVHLDGRPVRTPRKAALLLPTEALAEAVADEWRAVEDKVDPSCMPFTRGANSAIDTVLPQHQAVVAALAEYGGSDLLCYRAVGPEALILRQSQAWDPILDWAEGALGAPLVITAGVIHVPQPKASLDALTQAVNALSPFQIAAFHDLVALSGSLVLALAVTRGRLAAEAAWSLSRIDEDWQTEQWGSDEEGVEVADLKRTDFLHADRFFSLCG